MAVFGYSLPLGLSLILKNPPEKVIVRWKEEEWLDRCSYRSIRWTHASENPTFLLVQVHGLDRYKHPLSSHPSSQRHLAKQPHIAPHCRHVESAWL